MPTVDWIFLGVLLGSVVLGAWRGLVHEVLALLNWMLAFVVAQWFAPDAALHISWIDIGEPLHYAAGFVLVFVASVFMGSLVILLIKKAIALVGLAPIDRVLGAGFGCVRGVVLLLAATLVVGMTPLHTSTAWVLAQGPHVARVLLKGLKPLLSQDFGKYLPE